MLKDTEILDGINAVLCKGFPNRTVYINVQKEDCDRPSFFIVSGRKSVRPATSATVERTVRYSILAQEDMDENGISSLEELQNTQAKIFALFLAPFRCGDRHLVAMSEAVPVEDTGASQVDLTIVFHDDTMADTSAEEDAPLMEHIHSQKRFN
ncbi:MAG: hypothetical protein J1E60_07090 [Christensenellaceae bacterium]|nr:hypothetical protein [Christensenellaceae bacterium]